MFYHNLVPKVSLKPCFLFTTFFYTIYIQEELPLKAVVLVRCLCNIQSGLGSCRLSR